LLTTILFHVGAHRTGTTFVQHSLRAVADALQERGTDYLIMPRELAAQFWSFVRVGNAAREDAVVDQTAALFAGLGPSTIMSWEGVLGPAFVDGALYGHRAHGISVLRKAADLAGVDLRVVLTIRAQADFIRSWYGLMMKGGNPMPADEFVKSINFKALDWRPVIRDIEGGIGNCTVVPFELCKADPQSFLQAVIAPSGGETQGLTFSELPRNPSPSQAGAQIIQYLNQHATIDKEKRRALYTMISRATAGGPAMRLLNEHQTRRLATLYRAANGAILAQDLPESVRVAYGVVPEDATQP